MHLVTLAGVIVTLISRVAANGFCQVPINMPPHPPSSATSSSHHHHRTSMTLPPSYLPTPVLSTTTKVHTTYTYTHGPHESRFSFDPSLLNITNQFQAIAVGYPLCGIPGYTNAMGDYRESTHVQKGGNLKDCMSDCRNSGGACQSIAFHKRYTMCLWFDKEVQGTWLTIDKTSEFVHWDLTCDI